MASQDQSQKAARFAKELENIRTWYEKPNGSDKPFGETFRALNKSVAQMVLMKGFEDTSLDKWSGSKGYNVRFGIYSQSSFIQINSAGKEGDNGQQMILSRQHLAKFWHKGEKVSCLRSSISADQLNKTTLTAKFLEELNVKLNEYAAEYIVEYGSQHKDSNQHGVEIMMVRVKGGQDYPDNATLIANNLSFQAPAALFFVREKYRLKSEVTNELWQYLTNMDEFWFYKDQIVEGGYMKFLEDPINNVLRYPEWMVSEETKDMPTHSQKVGSFAVDYRFFSMNKYKHLMSIPIIREFRSQHDQIAEDFGEGHVHEGKTISNDNGHVVIEFRMSPKNDGNDTKGLPVHTTVTLVLANDEQTPANVTDTPGTDAEMTDAEEATPQWQSKVCECKGSQDFRIDINVSNALAHLFTPGSANKFKLQINLNATMSKRMLYAIQKFCNRAAPGTPKYDLQNIILQNGLAPSSVPSLFDQCPSAEKQELAAEYIMSCGLNEKQLKFALKFLLGNRAMQLFQGPPGTGKSEVVTVIATACALMGYSVGTCAPANGASWQLLEKLAICQENLKTRLDATKPNRGTKALKTYRVIYYPTMQTTKLELQVPRGTGVYQDLHMSSYLVEAARFLSRTQNRDNDLRADAQRWLGIYDSIQKNYGIPKRKERAWFLEMTDNLVPHVFNDSQPTIVVSTCSNIWTLTDHFKPKVVQIDEACQGTEQDCHNALALNPEFVLLAADQKQLPPTILAFSKNEGIQLMKTPMFTRLLGDPKKTGKSGHPKFLDDQLVVLDINYRFGKRIAMPASMLSYDFLGCGLDQHDNKLLQYKAVEEFFNGQDWMSLESVRPWPSDACKNEEGVGNFERLVFDPMDAFSSPAPCGHSLQNYGNCNMGLWLLGNLLQHKGKYTLKPEDITVISPYREQKALYEEQVAWRLAHIAGFEKIKFGTINMLQGDQNYITLLDLVTGNRFNAIQIGFLLLWLRMNVAITCARACLLIILNFARLYAELEIFAANEKTRVWALFLQDILEMGDLVKIHPGSMALNLPNTATEAQLDKTHWTRQQSVPTEKDCELTSEKLIKLRNGVKLHLRTNPGDGLKKALSSELKALRLEYNKRYARAIETQRQELAKKTDLQTRFNEAAAEETRRAAGEKNVRNVAKNEEKKKARMAVLRKEGEKMTLEERLSHIHEAIVKDPKLNEQQKEEKRTLVKTNHRARVEGTNVVSLQSQNQYQVLDDEDLMNDFLEMVSVVDPALVEDDDELPEPEVSKEDAIGEHAEDEDEKVDPLEKG
jgi:hypothetical protein